MSFAEWVNNGWVVAHKSSKQEIANLLGIVARDLKDSQAKDVSDDWRFAIAYNDRGPCGRRISCIPRESSLPGHSVTGIDPRERCEVHPRLRCVPEKEER